MSFEHVRGLKFSDPAYLAGQKQRYTATGVGAILEYDSRDFIPSPFRGVYVSFQETLFWLRICMPYSTPTALRGRCSPAWAEASGCAATTRAAIRTTT